MRIVQRWVIWLFFEWSFECTYGASVPGKQMTAQQRGGHLCLAGRMDFDDGNANGWNWVSILIRYNSPLRKINAGMIFRHVSAPTSRKCTLFWFLRNLFLQTMYMNVLKESLILCIPEWIGWVHCFRCREKNDLSTLHWGTGTCIPPFHFGFCSQLKLGVMEHAVAGKTEFNWSTSVRTATQWGKTQVVCCCTDLPPTWRLNSHRFLKYFYTSEMLALLFNAERLKNLKCDAACVERKWEFLIYSTKKSNTNH